MKGLCMLFVVIIYCQIPRRDELFSSMNLCGPTERTEETSWLCDPRTAGAEVPFTASECKLVVCFCI